jgi:hypothetical protein
LADLFPVQPAPNNSDIQWEATPPIDKRAATTPDSNANEAASVQVQNCLHICHTIDNISTWPKLASCTIFSYADYTKKCIHPKGRKASGDTCKESTIL